MLKVLELFAGIGAVRKALNNAKIDYEIIGISEIDKYAIQSYNALYGETNNYGDISKINPEELPNFDLLVYGFPCQDISIAGNQKGLDEDSGTRSSLLWTAMNIIRIKKPKYLLMENVKNLLGATHKENFELYLSELQKLGYNTTYKIINANHFDCPQNRERIICFSVLSDKPNPLPDGTFTNKKVKDILDKIPNQKYFMDKTYIPLDEPTNGDSGLVQVGNVDMKATESIKRVYSIEGLCPTLTTMGGGHRQPKFLYEGKVRKLSPEECWRVMGFTEDDIKKVRNINMSDTQMYKQIGNSICVNVLEAVLKSQF